MIIKIMENKKIPVSRLIVTRKDHPVINALSQSFHLIKRPFILDSTPDISLIPKKKIQKHFLNVGAQNYTLETKKNEKIMSFNNFPGIKRSFFEIFNRQNAEKKIIGAEIAPKYPDMTSLLNLTTENQRLKQKIKIKSKTLTKNSSNTEIPTINTENALKPKQQKIIFRRSIQNFELENKKLLNRVKSSSNIPVTDHNWQKDIRKSPSSMKPEVFPLKKNPKLDLGIIYASNPYCNTCKFEWNYLPDDCIK